MANERDAIDDEMDRLLERARSKLKHREKDQFSEEHLKSICNTLDEPVNGILGYLASKTSKFYDEFECEIDNTEAAQITFNHLDKFPDLYTILKTIRPGSCIQVNYRLKKPNEEFQLEEIHERIDIHLRQDRYEFIYGYPDGDHRIISIRYDEMITTQQIESLRNWLFSSVINKVTKFIDG